MKSLAIIAMVIALAGCVKPSPEGDFVRIDGKPKGGDFEVALTVCRGETDKTRLTITAEPKIACDAGGCESTNVQAIRRVFVGCMAQHGYVWRDKGP